MRPADLVFLDAKRAAIVIYDGDIWLVDGVDDPALKELKWKRYASGLNESLVPGITGPSVACVSQSRR